MSFMRKVNPYDLHVIHTFLEMLPIVFSSLSTDIPADGAVDSLRPHPEGHRI